MFRNYPLFFCIVLFGVFSCSSDNQMPLSSDTSKDALSACNTITDCSDKETREEVCIKNGCVSISKPSKIVHIVFYPKYIESVVSTISFFRYYYFYSLDAVGNPISCALLLNNYNFNEQPKLNLIQQYEVQSSIGSTGSEMYTLPLPTLKDSLISFIFYDEKESVVALGCAEKVDTTTNNSIGIYPCKPKQINACLGQF